MARPKVLDLFCGAGGAGQGYADAGFDVTGIDIKARRCGYPAGEFIKADVLDVLTDLDYLRSFDLIHASPPCQTHTRAKHLRDAQGKGTSKVDLIPQTRNALAYAGVPYVIENVPGAPVRTDLLLCGSMFPELYVYDDTGRRWLQRHRAFELHGFTVDQPTCDHRGAGVRPLGVYAGKADNIPSGGQTCRTLAEGRALMGIPWMSWAALVEAIPPAYTQHIGAAFVWRWRLDQQPRMAAGLW
jgi:DNA (cytosine-5)-methyltransferase 1